MIRQATEADIPVIKKLTACNSQFGFVIKSSLLESVAASELLYEDVSGSFCRYHKRRDGITVIYTILVAAEYRNTGIGKAFIDLLEKPIMLKCPVTYNSNEFYKHLGFELLETQKGKVKDLNIWRLDC